MKKVLRIIAFSIILVLIASSTLVSYASKASESSFDPYGSAALGPSYPTQVATFFKIEKLLDVKKNKKEFVFTVSVNNSKENMYLTFPSLGGFRLSTEKKGYFNPEGTEKITYSSDKSGNIKIASKSGEYAVFNRVKETFRLDIYSKDKKCLVKINSEQIAFGYTRGSLAKMRLEMPLSNKESIYGTGERFNELEQVGKRVLMWNVDAGYHGTDAAEFWRSYKNVPILYSNRGYTLFYNSFYNASLDIGYTNQNKYSMEFGGPEFDVYLWTGTPEQNLVSYTKLTGTTVLYPKWAYSYSAGGGSAVWGDSYYATAVNAVEGYKKLGTPNLAAVYVEGISDADAKVYNVFNKVGTRVLKWNSPDYTNLSTYLPGYSSSQLPYARNAKALSQTSGTFLDFADELSVTALKNILKKQSSWGLSGGLLDFGELIQPASYFRSLSKTGYEMHNFFPYWYAKSYSEALSKLKGNNEFVFMSRSGCAGSQKYTGYFTGDQKSNFKGLQLQLIAGLTESAAGMTVWGGDLAGYAGVPSNEVFARGMEFATFQPLMRSHGTSSRFPWDYSTVGKETYKAHYWLRENLLNKIYSSAIYSHKTGLPMTETLTMKYPDDSRFNGVYQSYLFCDDLLVTPVLKTNSYLYDVVFPTGRWYSLWDSSAVLGGKNISVEAPINRSPVYIKAGSVIPVTVSDSLTLTDSMQDKKKTEALLVTVPDNDRTSIYYKDEKTSVLYASTIRNSNTFRVSCGKENDATAIILKGVAAYSVTVDGENLSRLNKKPSADKVGFYSSNNNETVISIGKKNWKNIDISLGKYEIKNLMTDASYNNDLMGSAVDNDAFTSYAFSSSTSAKDSIFTLKNTEKLQNIVVKWTNNYASSYTLWVSSDKKIWEKAYTCSDGYGSVDDIDLSGKEVKYIKFTDVKSGTTAPAMIYEIEAYPYVLSSKSLPYNRFDGDGYDNGNGDSNATIVSDEGVVFTDDQIIYIPGKKDKYVKYHTTYYYFPTWAIILISIGGVLLISGVVFFIIRHKKKKGKTKTLSK